MDRIWVKDMEMGQEVEGLYAVNSLQVRPYSNGEFLSMRLTDRTGKISAIFWGGSQKLFQQIQQAPLVQIKGRVKDYQGSSQLTIQNITPVGLDETIDEALFLPVAPIDREKWVDKLKSWRDSLSSEYYRRLWDLLFEDQECFPLFLNAPAGKQWHHPYLGGLLEHTESLIDLCDRIAGLYRYLNRDLLLTGALFHDVGKAEELIYRTTFDYSDSGRLIGHIVMGTQRVQRYLDRIPEFPKEEGLLLLHLILAHQGDTPESPRMPRCREALVLHTADIIDSQLSAFTREMSKPEVEGQNWTGYINLINRHLYRAMTEEMEKDTEVNS